MTAGARKRTPAISVPDRRSLRAGLRVLWINDDASFQGGAERYIHSVSSELRRRGVGSYLLYDPSRGHDSSFTEPFEGAYPLVGLSEQIDALRPDVIYLHQVAAREVIAKIGTQRVPAVRFFHDHAPFCLREHKYTALGLRTCTRSLGLGCYACCGGVVRSKKGRLRFARLSAKRKYLAAHDRIDSFVVGSRYMASEVTRHGIRPGDVHVIPLFAASHEPSGPTKRERDHFLFVGGLLRGKGLDLLLRALTIGPHEIRLTIVGTGPQEGELRSLVVESGLQDRVHFLGCLDPATVGRLYDRVAAVVIPSRSPETFGLVGVEALSHRTPVIASDVGGMAEWLAPGVTGLSFPSGDVGALANALGAVASQPHMARRMGAAGRVAVERRFRVEHHVDALLAVLAMSPSKEVA